jgi:hypothetical protein
VSLFVRRWVHTLGAFLERMVATMLLDGQGNRLEPIRKADRWRLFEALLNNGALANPLRTAVDGYVSDAVAAKQAGRDVVIDSTAAGPHVFGRLGTQWLSDYKHWLASKCSESPGHQEIRAEGMYGMMLWYMLADRPERWLAPPQGGKKAYKLLEADVNNLAPVPARRGPIVSSKYRGTTDYVRVMMELIRAAEYRGLTTCQDIAVMMGLPLQGMHMGQEIGHLLGEISEDESLAGRPMLSAVVVGVSGKPGPGFFSLARQLAKFTGTESEDDGYWNGELQSVYKAWRRSLRKNA